MQEVVITLLVWLITAFGITGFILLKEHTIWGCGVILAAYLAMRWLSNRWDFTKGKEE